MINYIVREQKNNQMRFNFISLILLNSWLCRSGFGPKSLVHRFKEIWKYQSEAKTRIASITNKEIIYNNKAQWI